MTRSFMLLAFALLAGCAALKPAERPETLRLMPRAAPAAAAVRPGGIAVAPVDASGAVAGRRYTYVLASDPLLLRQAATLFWEVPPAETLGHALVDALRTRFAAMDAGPAGARLATRLVRFEEVTGDGGARAVIALEATLAPTGGGPATTARYCRATPITGDGSGGRAAAFQDGVAVIAATVAADVAAGRLTPSDC